MARARRGQARAVREALHRQRRRGARRWPARCRAGGVVMEAFHYRYHPVFMRARRDSSRAGALGTVRRIETWLCFPLPQFSDIRYQLDLAGRGHHGRRVLRHPHGPPPGRLGARGGVGPGPAHSPGWTAPCRRSLRFPARRRGRVTCSMWSRRLLHVGFRRAGTRASCGSSTRRAQASTTGCRSQRGGAHGGAPDADDRPTSSSSRPSAAPCDGGALAHADPADAIANMDVIDAVYRHAGLEPRSPTP